LLGCLGALGGAASGAGAASRPCRNVNAHPNRASAAIVDAATTCLMNELRIAQGIRPLRPNRALAGVAAGQASDMVRGDYFGDQSISGQSPMARIMATSYTAHAASFNVLAAQNIGWGTGPNATPAGIVRAWMASPPHRQIILTGAYRDVGVGVAPAVPSVLGAGWLGGTYAVEFGARH
jgi:uncharacterized protein YkwD